MASIIPQGGRLIGTIIPDLVVEEQSNDSYEITSFPVQQGASINDHKYKKPINLKMTLLFSGDNQADLAKKYKSLLDLQAGNDLFDVTTPKRLYKNMQIRSLGVTTDKASENILSVTAEFQEVVIVSVSVVSVPPRANQKKPAKTGSTEKAGSKSATTPPEQKKSALATLFGG
ncbi:MAG TPA: hypothetical protein VFM18_22215 [Methanosarcina sp.]|nr:hypothetical protein [Methanosarcina sp.]